MFCQKCGKEINDKFVLCPYCGESVGNNNQDYNFNQSSTVQSNDTGGFGWSVLGFFFPIVGLILFLVWKSTKPKSAKAAGIGGIVGFICSIALYICMGVVVASTIYNV